MSIFTAHRTIGMFAFYVKYWSIYGRKRAIDRFSRSMHVCKTQAKNLYVRGLVLAGRQDEIVRKPGSLIDKLIQSNMRGKLKVTQAEWDEFNEILNMDSTDFVSRIKRDMSSIWHED